MLTHVTTQSAFRGLATDVMCGQQFTSRTVIFGRNGAGKSTLGDLLRLVELKQTGESASEIEPRPQFSHTPQPVRTFNADYVAETLGDFLNGEGSADSIPIGKGEQALEEQRRGILNLIGQRKASLDRVSKREASLKTTQEVGALAKSKVIENLSNLDRATYNTSSYKNTQGFRNKIRDCKGHSLSEGRKRDLYSTASEKTLSDIHSPKHPSIVTKQHREQLGRLLDTTPSEEAMKVLLDRENHTEWLRQGLHDYDRFDAPSCPFCTREAPADRIELIREALRSIENDLDTRLQAQSTEIRSLAASWQEYLDSTPNISSLTDSLKESYEMKLSSLESTIKSYTLYLDGLLQAIEAKQRSLSSLPIIGDLPEPPNPAPLDQIIRQHNQYASNQLESKQEALQQIERAILADYSTRLDEARANRSMIDRCKEALNRSLAALHRELEAITARQQDTFYMAKRLTSEIRALLGNTSISIHPSSEGKAYTVYRGLDAAKNLSTGEKNMIALSYFLCSLDSHGSNPENTVVVLDDPVSSLDRENASAVFSRINYSAKRWGQLIITTHDFDFLRRCIRAWAGNKSASVMEITKGSAGSGGSPGSSLRRLPQPHDEFTSEYHYLFQVVSECATGQIEDRLLPIFGNSARRLLESFLSFVRPNTPELRNALNSAWPTHGIDGYDTLPERALAFSNDASHDMSVTPNESHPKTYSSQDFAALLFVMKEINSDHFENMCEGISLPHPQFGNPFKRQFGEFYKLKNGVPND